MLTDTLSVALVIPSYVLPLQVLSAFLISLHKCHSPKATFFKLTPLPNAPPLQSLVGMIYFLQIPKTPGPSVLAFYHSLVLAKQKENAPELQLSGGEYRVHLPFLYSYKSENDQDKLGKNW